MSKFLTNSPGNTFSTDQQAEFARIEQLSPRIRKALYEAPFKIAAAGFGLDWTEEEMLESIELTCQRRLSAETSDQ